MISVSQLTKIYGHVTAVDRISFDVDQSNYVIKINSSGPDRKFEPEQSYLGDDFLIWTSRIDYFAESRARIDELLSKPLRTNNKFPQNERELSEAISRLSQLREELKAAIDADAESYNAVMSAYKRAKDSANADGMVDSALKRATSIPLSVAERAREVSSLVETLRPITNPNMKSDLTTAAALARAAIEGALANVEINLESLKDAEFVSRVRKQTAGIVGR